MSRRAHTIAAPSYPRNWRCGAWDAEKREFVRLKKRFRRWAATYWPEALQ